MPRKRAEIPSVEMLFGSTTEVTGNYQTSSGKVLPTLEEYLFNPPQTKKEQKAEEESFQTVVASNMRATTSTNPKRPRTIKAGYDAKSQVMTVVFRDGTWWNYYDVPPYMWQGFILADSKGAYLASSGLDQWPKMGPADPAGMPTYQRVQLNDTKDFAQYMYGEGSGFAVER